VLPVIVGLVLVPLGLMRLDAAIAVQLASDPVSRAEAGDRSALAGPSAPLAALTGAALRTGAPHVLALAARGWAATAALEPSDAPAALEEAAHLLRRALAQAPADPRAWLRLAYVESQRQRWAASVQAWSMSSVVAPYDPLLFGVRLEGGLALWPYMDLQARDRFAGQAELAWDNAPAELLVVFRRHPQHEAVLRAAARNPALAAALASGAGP
jgi:hypothetical protein